MPTEGVPKGFLFGFLQTRQVLPTELHPLFPHVRNFFFQAGLFHRLSANSHSSCLRFMNASVIGICHHAQPPKD